MWGKQHNLLRRIEDYVLNYEVGEWMWWVPRLQPDKDTGTEQHGRSQILHRNSPRKSRLVAEMLSVSAFKSEQ